MNNVGKDAVNSILGNTESAVIKIHDYRAAVAGLGKERLEAVQSILKSGNAPPFGGMSAEEKIFTVQFNPTEMNIYAKGEQVQKQSPEQGPAETAVAETYTVEPPRVEFSVRLIFDHVVNQDAFLADKILPTASAVAGNALKLAGMAADKLLPNADSTVGEYSVRPEIEGILAILQNRYTRLITFQWGDFSFTGSLEDVQAEYTMFSLSGRPIRGTVSLRVVQDCAVDTMLRWQKDYKTAFSDGAADLGSAAQKLESVLNLPI